MSSRAVAPVVVAGVSGSGKSTVGALLAERLGVPFVDGDALHPPANVAKMAAGIPLDDADRGPWLDAVGERLAAGSVVVACSALRRAYRDRLRAAAPSVRIVLLDGTRELLGERMAARAEHFMPPALLDSQLATLERPAPDEHVAVYDVAVPPAELADAVLHDLEDA
ncbi:gluconokinase [Protaetiibacter intestinalis]|uniref:Gluconokinase n=1 Tax=Protaetiibacter intestinalis TaxID=2419774 RepID=A0A387BIP6_9MICO|nr:gluconokinase [Protaetiibacter intestinalis]AYF98400.1 gluconokinase [Protaetiibacter intestinalis]